MGHSMVHETEAGDGSAPITCKFHKASPYNKLACPQKFILVLICGAGRSYCGYFVIAKSADLSEDQGIFPKRKD